MLGSMIVGLFLHLPLFVHATEILDDAVAFVDVDEYSACARARGGLYCFVSANLRGDASHSLYNTLVEHSANNVTHFNRTNVHRGICLKTSCREYLSSSSVMRAVEACVNASVSKAYGLSARVFRAACTQLGAGAGARLDLSDYAFGAVVLLLLALNILGSLYDYCGGIGQDTLAGKVLVCFSLRRNWCRLVAPASREPEQRRLQCLSFYRVFLNAWVVLGHVGIPFMVMVKNIEYFEQLYDNAFAQLFYNGPQIVQVFFIMSAFLSAYNLLAAEKKRPLHGWRNLLKALFLRWLRLTPLYALVIFFTATWMRHMGEGPFWKVVVGAETSDCRRDWWLHLLYIQNYFDFNSHCMLQSWFLPVDMQLTVIGLSIFFLLKTTKARHVAIGLLVTVGLIAPGAFTYLHDLDAVTLVTPEVALGGFVESAWFNLAYKRVHPHLLCYGLGLALAHLVFHLHHDEIGAAKYKKYRLVHWLLTPASLLVLMSGAWFYGAGPRAPLPARALYASGVKLLFGTIACFQIFCSIVQVDGLYKRVYRWHGWTVLRRLTYGVFLAHMALLVLLAGNMPGTVRASQAVLWKGFVLVASSSFLVAAALFVTVEAPCEQLMKIFLQRKEIIHSD